MTFIKLVKIQRKIDEIEKGQKVQEKLKKRYFYNQT